MARPESEAFCWKKGGNPLKASCRRHPKQAFLPYLRLAARAAWRILCRPRICEMQPPGLNTDVCSYDRAMKFMLGKA